MLRHIGAQRPRRFQTVGIINEMLNDQTRYVNNSDAKTALREFGVTDTMLHCPAALEAESPGSYSYELLQSTNTTDVIIRENRSNHRGKGGCVAFRDGHVEWSVGR